MSVAFRSSGDRVGVISLDRPEARNALTVAMRAELTRVLTVDHGCAVLVLRAEGPHFSAGADVKELAAAADPRELGSVVPLLLAMREAPPIVAAVGGYALGLGAGLAMASDVVVAADDLRLGYPEVGSGAVAGELMADLREVAGVRLAADLLLSGRHLGAAEAAARGVVSEVVPAGDLDAAALDRAARLARAPAAALLATKRMFRTTGDRPYRQALEFAESVRLGATP